MVMVGILNLNGIEASNEGDIVAAFVDGEVRGIASPVFDDDVGQNIIFMIIHGDDDGDELTFQVYDITRDEVIDLANRETFGINGIRGTVIQPVVWSERALKTEAVFLSFFVTGQINQEENDQEILIDIPIARDVTNSMPVFSISEGAEIFIADQEQESGVSVVDLSQPVTYAIWSEDKQTINEIRVVPNFVLVSSVGTVIDENINVFPNPTTSSLTYFSKSNYQGEVLINIHDVNGKLILSNSVDKKFNEMTIDFDLSDLGKGIYILNAYYGTGLVNSVQVIKN